MINYELPETVVIGEQLLEIRSDFHPILDICAYLAVLGDQSSGTNIETPLSTMVAAFKTALAESSYGMNQAQLVVDGVTFGELVWKHNQAQGNRIGTNLVTRGT
jgi:hypothetical protein